jgi:hypothetical protein
LAHSIHSQAVVVNSALQGIIPVSATMDVTVQRDQFPAGPHESHARSLKFGRISGFFAHFGGILDMSNFM